MEGAALGQLRQIGRLPGNDVQFAFVAKLGRVRELLQTPPPREHARYENGARKAVSLIEALL